MSSSKQKYIIKPYSYQQAEKLGVQIFASDNPKKKIEVYDSEGNFMFYGGDPNFLDYPSYMELEERGLAPVGYAKERRRLYRIRHKKELDKINSKGWFIGRLLW